jgi:hypothetical protein
MRSCLLLRFLILAMCLAGVHRAAAQTQRFDTADLLVQRARDFALRHRADPSPQDIAEVQLLLEAAARLDDDLVPPRIWLYELAALSSQREQAARRLAEVLRADPAHETAFLGWLEAGIAERQTNEDRAEWLTEVAATERPAHLRVHVHTALARVALARFDVAGARAHLDEALDLQPYDLDARVLQLELLDPNAPPAAQIKAHAAVLEVAPRAAESAWRIAALLDEHGFNAQAHVFFEYARRVHRLTQPGVPPPGAFSLDYAYHLLARHEITAARDQIQAAIRVDPQVAPQAAMLLYHLLEQQQTGAGDEIRDALATRFATVRDPNEHAVNEVAQAAWFHVTLAPQPDRALMLARNAAERAGQDQFVQRVLGWALVANLEPEAAREVLEPLASTDAYAAVALARLFRDDEQPERAAAVLNNLRVWPPVGPARTMLSGLATTLGAAVTTQPARSAAARYPDLVAALNDFDARVLHLVDTPDKYLHAELTLAARSFPVGAPWYARFRLTNRGPFPITLGAQGMVNPVFVVSFEVEGDRPRRYPALLTVSLERKHMLAPGESTEHVLTLDVGPLDIVARHTPQKLQRVSVTALLSPVQDENGQWQPGPFGQRIGPVHFNRMPASTSSTALNVLFDSLAEPSPAVRTRAISVVAALLGEQQRAAAQRLEYRPAPLSTARLQDALLTALRANHWQLRAWVLDALQITGLTRNMVTAVEARLQDRHWLARLLAVRVLARQGPSFAPQAQQIAESDDDELVRRLARIYLERWSPAPEASGDE